MKNFSSILIFSVLWLAFGLLGDHANAATITSVSLVDYTEKQYNGTLPGLEDFHQATWISIKTSHPKKLFSFQGAVPPGNLLIAVRGNKNPKQRYLNSQDRRYSLKMQIFPFHFFW